MTSAIDFGVLPLSASTLNAFAVAPEGGALPAVRPEQWQRFSPLPADMLGDSTRFSDAELLVLSEWVIRNDMVDLYPLGQPEIQIDGEQLSTRLVPMGGVPITAADIGNLVIKLKPMFYIITEAAGILARSLHK